MVATLPCVIGTRFRAIRKAPDSHAANIGWEGAIVEIDDDHVEDDVVRPIACARFVRGIPSDRSFIDQFYFKDEFTTENVEILEGL